MFNESGELNTQSMTTTTQVARAAGLDSSFTYVWRSRASGIQKASAANNVTISCSV
jgi:hypothetical protein